MLVAPRSVLVASLFALVSGCNCQSNEPPAGGDGGNVDGGTSRVLLNETFAGNALSSSWAWEGFDGGALHGVQNEMLELWTPASTPPYYAAVTTRAQRVLDLNPRGTGTLTLTANFKARLPMGPDQPSLNIGIIGQQDLLLQVFANASGVFARYGVSQTHPVQSDTWYKLTVTADTQLHVTLTDAQGLKVLDEASPISIDLSTLQVVQLSVSINDTASGQARIFLDDVRVEQRQ